MIEECFDLEVLRQAFGDSRQARFDLSDNVQGRGATILHYAQQRAAYSVLANDVGLWGEAVAYMSDVTHIDRRAVLGFDREIVQLGNCLRAAIHAHIHFQAADLCGAGGKNQVLRVDRIHYVYRSQPVRLKSLRVQVDGDHSRFSTIGVRNCGAFDRR